LKPAACTALINVWLGTGFPKLVTLGLPSKEFPRFHPGDMTLTTCCGAVPVTEPLDEPLLEPEEPPDELLLPELEEPVRPPDELLLPELEEPLEPPDELLLLELEEPVRPPDEPLLEPEEPAAPDELLPELEAVPPLDEPLPACPSGSLVASPEDAPQAITLTEAASRQERSRTTVPSLPTCRRFIFWAPRRNISMCCGRAAHRASGATPSGRRRIQYWTRSHSPTSDRPRSLQLTNALLVRRSN
jgi:hypothetical protein